MLNMKIILLCVLAIVCATALPAVIWSPPTFMNIHAETLSTAADLPMPLYKPRKHSSHRARIGGQTRGAETDAPVLIALVPDHVGFTIKNDPSLCWYLSQQTSKPVMFTVVDSRGIRPILERSLPTPVRAGIHCVRLRDYGVGLKEQEPYKWFVTLIVNPNVPSQDIVAGGMIERIPLDEACTLDMPCSWGPCEREVIYRYTESGLWYDAISCLVELIEHDQDKDTFHKILDHLLKQSGVYLPG
jgi:Domain of Unknown Function (DUF928)